MITVRHLLGVIKRNLYRIPLVGFRSTVSLILNELSMPSDSFSEDAYRLLEEKHAIIRKYIASGFHIMPSNEIEVKASPYKEKIWVLWWQGQSEMPDIVKACYKSICEHSAGHDVILITKDNYADYVDVPFDIMDKANRKQMMFAHLSDFIRLQLLSRYGGLWIDSTFLLTADIPQDVFKYGFYSLRTHGTDNLCVGKYRYFVSFMACQPYNGIMFNAFEIFKTYWLHHSKALDYLFMDYCIDYVCGADKDYAEQLSSIPYNNLHTLDYLNNINNVYNSELLDKWNQDTYAYKLNWKYKLKRVVGGKETFYGHLINMYLL